MNDLDFRDQILDPISPSFCAAKWYNATIWLGSGMTTSCHHPPAHKIDADALAVNPSALHNTGKKKLERAQMQNGVRPAGCEYCWKIEDMGRAAVSDRVYKSKIYPIKALHDAAQTPSDYDINLKTLEISFDRTCNFACSYCNPAFSTTWANDIRRDGPYVDLVSDGRNHFTHDHASSQLYTINETNPYVEAFFAWWETDLHRTLQELRITGGEPLMSGYTWKLIDWFKNNSGNSQTRLAINSNLGLTSEKLNDFIERVQGIPHLEVYTSNEAVDTAAEYIRDGLDYQQWMHNAQELLASDSIQALHVMCTINALCLTTLPNFLSQLMGLKQQYGRQRVSFTLNILRFPSFQSALVLPDNLRTQFKNNIEAWLEIHRTHPLLQEHEINHLQRLVDYLDVVKTPHSEAFDRPALLNDFKQFHQQYDLRRNKNFVDSFPALADWYVNL